MKIKPEMVLVPGCGAYCPEILKMKTLDLSKGELFRISEFSNIFVATSKSLGCEIN
jgi:hypothetical protein